MEDHNVVRERLSRYWPDLDFHVEGEVFDYRMEFKLYDRWSEDSWKGGMGPVRTIEEAKTDIHGFIKWDGCANTTIGDSCMWHTCDRDRFAKLGEALTRVWDLAADAIPHSICEAGKNS